MGEIGTNRSDVLSQIGDRVRQVKNSTYMVSNLYYYDERLRLQMEELAAGGENEEALTSYMDGLTGQYKQSLYSGEMDYDVHLVLDNGWSYHSNREEGGRMMNPKIRSGIRICWWHRGRSWMWPTTRRASLPIKAISARPGYFPGGWRPSGLFDYLRG